MDEAMTLPDSSEAISKRACMMTTKLLLWLMARVAMLPDGNKADVKT